jgi:hypothetical protein
MMTLRSRRKRSSLENFQKKFSKRMSIVRALREARDGALAHGAEGRIFPMRIAVDIKKTLLFQGKMRARQKSHRSTAAARDGTYVASPLSAPSG